MKPTTIGLFLAFVVLFLAATVPGQCVECRLSSGRRPQWECVGTARGAQTCTTSVDNCTLAGVCGGNGGEGIELENRPSQCTDKRIGLTVSQDIIDAVSSQSKTFGEALAFAYAHKTLGAERAKVFTIEAGAAVEIDIELVAAKRPFIRLTRADTQQTLNLSLARDFSVSVTDANRWAVTGWSIK